MRAIEVFCFIPVENLSQRGKDALAGHGVTRVVDLRFPEELAEDPEGDLPAEVVHVSLFGETRTDEWQAEQYAAMDEAPSADAYLLGWYGEFLDRYRDRFGLAVQECLRGAGVSDAALDRLRERLVAA